MAIYESVTVVSNLDEEEVIAWGRMVGKFIIAIALIGTVDFLMSASTITRS
jgi:hypothetical protein